MKTGAGSKADNKSDADTTIHELKDVVARFIEERNWERFHTPKNLAMSLAVEAAELMEHYTWHDDAKSDPEDVADELADVLFNVLSFANRENIDISTAFLNKIRKTAQKYPKEILAKDGADLETYRRLKYAHRAKKGNT